MATYYKYAERNASSEINWTEISKNLTDTLNEEARIREKKKDAIDQASREYGTILSNAPTGESEGVNQWSLEYANNAQQARLMQDRMLKNGTLKLKDYNIMRQNLIDGTKGAFDLISEYQAEYKEKMERYMSNNPDAKSQELENYLMRSAEGFSNFSTSQLYINPTNYEVSVAKKSKNDKGVYVMSENPNDFVTINDMRNRIKSKFNYFNYNNPVDQLVGGLAEVTRVVKDKGGYLTVTDALQRGEMQNLKGTIAEIDKAIDSGIESMLVSEYNITSLLTDDIGGFDFTFDEAEAKQDKNLILLEKNSNGLVRAKITDQQKQIAKKFLKDQTISRIDRKEEYKQKTIYYPPSYVYDAGKNQQMMSNFGNSLAKFYGGNERDVTAAGQNFFGMSNVGGVVRRGDKAVFTVVNNRGENETKEIDMVVNGRPIGVQNFVESAVKLIMGDAANTKDALQGSNWQNFQNYNSETTLDKKSEVRARNTGGFNWTGASPKQ